MSELPYVVSAGMFLAVMMITIGIMQKRGHFRPNRLVARLKPQEAGEMGDQSSFATGELTPWRKMAAPALEIIKHRFGARFSKGGLQATEALLIAANRPYGMTAVDFHALKILSAAVLGVFGFVYSALLGDIGIDMLPLVVLGLLGGYVLPDYHVKRALAKRRATITREIILVLDLLAMAVQHGVDEKIALRVVSEKVNGLLGKELSIVVRDMDRGMNISDAFKELHMRCDTPEVYEVYNNVIRLSAIYGTPMKDVLKGISDKVRHQVSQKADEEAEKSKVHVYLPLGLCNVPAMFLVLLGPTLLMIYRLF